MTLDKIKEVAESYGCKFYKTEKGFRVEYSDGLTYFIVNETCIRTYRFDEREGYLYFDSNIRVEKHGDDYNITERHLRQAITSAIESQKQVKIHQKKRKIAEDFDEDKN